MIATDVRGPQLCEVCRYNSVVEPTDWNGRELWICWPCYRKKIAAFRYGEGRF